MSTHQLFTRTTFVAALLSAFALAQPAHAGLLGGGGGAGIGGGLGGFGGGAGAGGAGSIQREGALPRPDRKAVGGARQAKEQTAERAGAAQERAADAAGTPAQGQGGASVDTQSARGTKSANAGATAQGQASRQGRSANAGVSVQGSAEAGAQR